MLLWDSFCLQTNWRYRKIDSKEITGSYEQRRVDVLSAIKESGAITVGDGDYMWVAGTFEDRVIVNVSYNDAASKQYEVAYTISDDSIDIGEITEVEVEEVVRPKSGGNMEHKSFPFEVKASEESDGGGWIFEGYASTFDNLDDGGDIVRKGAFARTLGTRPVVVKSEHGETVGKILHAKEDDKGLFVRGEILPTSKGQDAYILAKGGAITSLSMGWTPAPNGIKRTKSGRELVDIDLWEVSLVTFPMNRLADITSVKSYNFDDKSISEILTDAGLMAMRSKSAFEEYMIRRMAEGREISDANSDALGQATLSLGYAFAKFLELDLDTKSPRVREYRRLLRDIGALFMALDSESVSEPSNDDDEEDEKETKPKGEETPDRVEVKADPMAIEFEHMAREREFITLLGE